MSRTTMLKLTIGNTAKNFSILVSLVSSLLALSSCNIVSMNPINIGKSRMPIPIVVDTNPKIAPPNVNTASKHNTKNKKLMT